MTVDEDTVNNYQGYHQEGLGKISNNTIVLGRTDRGVIDDQFRYPWDGYVVSSVQGGTALTLVYFDSEAYPTVNEVARWTLVLTGRNCPSPKRSYSTALPPGHGNLPTS